MGEVSKGRLAKRHEQRRAWSRVKDSGRQGGVGERRREVEEEGERGSRGGRGKVKMMESDEGGGKGEREGE